MGRTRWYVRIAALMAVVCTLAVTALAASPVGVTVQGREVVWTDARPFLLEGRTMVPMRACAEAMGLEVQWDPVSRRVDFSKRYTPQSSVYQAELENGQKEYVQTRTVSMWIGNSEYSIRNQYGLYDGRSVTQGRTYTKTAQMDAAAILREDRTYAPIRYVAEQFGYDVIWDGTARMVRLVSEQPVDWNYTWSIDDGAATGQGSLILAIHTGSGLSEVKIAAVTVRCTTTSSTADGAQKLRAASQSDLQRIYNTVGADVALLDAARVEYPFLKGQTYTIEFTLSLTKANGATGTVSEQFQVEYR